MAADAAQKRHATSNLHRLGFPVRITDRLQACSVISRQGGRTTESQRSVNRRTEIN
jgi:hypothetical protein